MIETNFLIVTFLYYYYYYYYKYCTFVIVFTDLSGKEPHKYVHVNRAIASERIEYLMVRTLVPE